MALIGAIDIKVRMSLLLEVKEISRSSLLYFGDSAIFFLFNFQFLSPNNRKKEEEN